MEKYTPVRELPEDIQKLDHGETVCRFCGVSYLVHHEIKKLEDKLQLLEKEIRNLESQRQTWDATRSTLIQELAESKEDRLSLEHRLDQSKEKLVSITEQYALLDDRAQSQETELATARYKASREKENFFADKLPLLQDCVQQLRHSKAQVQELLVDRASDLKALERTLIDVFAEKEQAHQHACKQLRCEVASTQRQLAEEKQRHQELQSQWQTEIKTLQEAVRTSSLQHTALQSQLESTKRDLEDSVSSASTERKQASSMAEKVRKLEAEISQLQTATDKRCALKDQEMERLMKVMKSSQDESTQQAEASSLVLQAKEKVIVEMKSEFAAKSDMMEKSYQQSQAELSLEKDKVKSLISSHSDEIVMLRQMHDQALSQKRAQSKELEKEFERVQKQLKSVQNNTQAKLTELKSTLAISELQHKRGIEKLQEELQREKNISDRELSRHLDQVRELELQLTQQRRAGVERQGDMAAGLEQLKHQLREKEGQCVVLREKLAQAYKEVTILQSTVERECEEREELLAKLKLATTTTTTKQHVQQQQRYKTKQ